MECLSLFIRQTDILWNRYCTLYYYIPQTDGDSCCGTGLTYRQYFTWLPVCHDNNNNKNNNNIFIETRL